MWSVVSLDWLFSPTTSGLPLLVDTACHQWQLKECVCVKAMTSVLKVNIDVADNIFHLDVHYVCYTVLLQHFELQGRCFTNFHYYYYRIA